MYSMMNSANKYDSCQTLLSLSEIVVYIRSFPPSHSYISTPKSGSTKSKNLVVGNDQFRDIPTVIAWQPHAECCIYKYKGVQLTLRAVPLFHAALNAMLHVKLCGKNTKLMAMTTKAKVRAHECTEQSQYSEHMCVIQAATYTSCLLCIKSQKELR